MSCSLSPRSSREELRLYRVLQCRWSITTSKIGNISKGKWQKKKALLLRSVSIKSYCAYFIFCRFLSTCLFGLILWHFVLVKLSFHRSQNRLGKPFNTRKSKLLHGGNKVVHMAPRETRYLAQIKCFAPKEDLHSIMHNFFENRNF